MALSYLFFSFWKANTMNLVKLPIFKAICEDSHNDTKFHNKTSIKVHKVLKALNFLKGIGFRPIHDCLNFVKFAKFFLMWE